MFITIDARLCKGWGKFDGGKLIDFTPAVAEAAAAAPTTTSLYSRGVPHEVFNKFYGKVKKKQRPLTFPRSFLLRLPRGSSIFQAHLAFSGVNRSR